MAKKPKLSASAHALVVLSDPQIGHGVQFEKSVIEQLRAEHLLILQFERTSALRGIRLGIVLFRLKSVMGHGKFMPAVKAAFKGCTHRTAGRYMQIARHFVESCRADVPEVLTLADTKFDLTLAGSASAPALLKKAVKFVGDKSLSELIAEATKAAGTPAAKSAKQAAPDAEQLYLFSRDEIGGGLSLLETLLVKENRLQHFAGHPEEIAGVVDSLRTLADKVEAAAKPLLKK